jgi:hypothetical protein
MHSGMEAAARAEGIADAKSYANMTDTGYVSLNTGVLWLQIGGATGNAPVQELSSGDTLKVHEVDKVYIALGSAPADCRCQPEKYTVYAYVEKGEVATRVQLNATKYATENTSECGATPTGNLGCGTTDFVVP